MLSVVVLAELRKIFMFADKQDKALCHRVLESQIKDGLLILNTYNEVLK
jgi:hypothetical protein